MFTGVNASMQAWSVSSFCAYGHCLVTPVSRSLPYTLTMRHTRSIHLLIAAAILFSQIVAGIHMAGHVQIPVAALASASAPLSFGGAIQSEHSKLARFGSESGAGFGSVHKHAIPGVAFSDGVPSQNALDQSCVIYHIYAGSHCVSVSPAALLVGTSLASRVQAVQPPVLAWQQFEHNVIRGPPVLS